MTRMNSSSLLKQKQAHRHREQTDGGQGRGAGAGRTGSFGLADVQTPRNRMGKQGLLYCNTGNNTQYPVIKHHGKECEKEYICIMESFCYTAEMNTNCKATLLQ